MIDTERTAEIKIGGKSYELLLTTGATKEIAKRYGGLENLGNTMLRSCHQKHGTDAVQLSDSGDKLMKSENFEMAIGEIVWLVTLLANQPILIRNLTSDVDFTVQQRQLQPHKKLLKICRLRSFQEVNFIKVV